MSKQSSAKPDTTPNQEADFRTAILKGNTPGIRASILLDLVQQHYNTAITAGPEAITLWNSQLTGMRGALCTLVGEGAGAGSAMGLGSRGAGAGGKTGG